jgi:hypothetical protein
VWGADQEAGRRSFVPTCELQCNSNNDQVIRVMSRLSHTPILLTKRTRSMISAQSWAEHRQNFSARHRGGISAARMRCQAWPILTIHSLSRLVLRIHGHLHADPRRVQPHYGYWPQLKPYPCRGRRSGRTAPDLGLFRGNRNQAVLRQRGHSAFLLDPERVGRRKNSTGSTSRTSASFPTISSPT